MKLAIKISFNFVIFLFTFIHKAESTINCSTIIVPKKQWAGATATNVEYQIIPLKYVVVHHTVTDTCSTKSSCATTLQNIQNYHMNNLQYSDIGYNFLIGNDGRVYEGAGWHIVGAHTYGYNRNGLGIAFMDKLPTGEAINAAKNLLECGVEKGELDSQYKLLGGRQLIASESPGLDLYVDLQDWDHWVSKP